MKNQSKKLMGYSAAAGALLLSGSAAEDKVYYDVDPDIQLIGENFFLTDTWVLTSDLDVNNDDIVDFKLRLVASSDTSAWAAFAQIHHGDLYPVGDNEVFIANTAFVTHCKAANFAGWFNFVGELNDGDLISPAPATGFFTSSSGVITSFDPGENQVMFFNIKKNYWAESAYCTGYPLKNKFGYWITEEIKHVAILFHKDGLEYPGWVRLSVGGAFEITLYDFAIGLEAGGTIQAGDTSDAIITVPPVTNTTAITDVSARLKWSNIEGALQYQVRYRPVGSTSWLYTSTSALKKKITSLTCATEYEWQVKAELHNSPLFYSFWSDTATFTTAACRLGDDNMSDDELFITVSPNPASEFLQVMLDGEYEGATIELRNLAGQLVLSKLADDEIITLGIQDIPSGVYMLQVLHDGKTYAEKVIVNN